MKNNNDWINKKSNQLSMVKNPYNLLFHVLNYLNRFKLVPVLLNK